MPIALAVEKKKAPEYAGHRFADRSIRPVRGGLHQHPRASARSEWKQLGAGGNIIEIELTRSMQQQYHRFGVPSSVSLIWRPPGALAAVHVAWHNLARYECFLSKVYPAPVRIQDAAPDDAARRMFPLAARTAGTGYLLGSGCIGGLADGDRISARDS
jgi:hypothetical protein